MDDVKVRAAEPEDYPHYQRLYPELGTGDLPADRELWIATVMPRTLLLDEQRVPVAYSYYDVLSESGYIRNIVVTRSHRRRGLGAIMMQALAERFRSAGCTEWRLNVLDDNTAAIALYERLGMRRAFHAVAVTLPIAAIERLPAAAPGLRVSALAGQPENQLAVLRELEQRFAMPRGLLSALHGRSSEQLLMLVDDARPEAGCLGVARLMIHRCTAYPFRLLDADHARPLLTAMREHLPPEADTMHLVCEDDAGLAELLLRIGGRVKHSLEHYHGLLPVGA